MKAQQSNKDKERAKWLRENGWPHGRRPSVTRAPCVPDMRDVGSAKYRRRQK